MLRSLVGFSIAILTAGAAWGQSSSPPDQTELVKVLLERIQQLEKHVAEMDSRLTALSPSSSVPVSTPAAQAAAPPPATAGAEHEHAMPGDRVDVRQMETHYPSLQVRGFGDVDFSATDQKGANSGFNMGQLDLHLASALSQKVSYFGEITFNAQPTGYTTEVERSIIRYDFNDFFKISFGRYHTPIGYWNTAYHHGTWLQTSISRPDMVRIGGTFIPVHFVGFLIEGNIPSGGAGLSYNVGLGNGRGSTISRPGDAGDNNNNRAWVANLFARPAKLYGLQLGASVYRDKITLANGTDYREWISSAHLAWTKGSPEFLAEVANVNHRNLFTNAVSNSDAFYAQIGYRLPWLERNLKPYYRFEYTHTPLHEQLFANLDLVGSVLGLRYDITNFASFKSEYRNSRRLAGEPRVNGVFFQTAFTF